MNILLIFWIQWIFHFCHVTITVPSSFHDQPLHLSLPFLCTIIQLLHIYSVFNQPGLTRFRLGLTRVDCIYQSNKCINCSKMFQEFCAWYFNNILGLELSNKKISKYIFDFWVDLGWLRTLVAFKNLKQF